MLIIENQCCFMRSAPRPERTLREPQSDKAGAEGGIGAQILTQFLRICNELCQSGICKRVL